MIFGPLPQHRVLLLNHEATNVGLLFSAGRAFLRFLQTFLQTNAQLVGIPVDDLTSLTLRRRCCGNTCCGHTDDAGKTDPLPDAHRSVLYFSNDH